MLQTIPKPSQYKTVTDMREDPVGLLKQSNKSNNPLIMTYQNSPKSVLLSIKKYNEIMDLVEDYYDNILLEKHQKNTKSTDYIDENDVLNELGIKV